MSADPNPVERMMMFRRGFGDGAKCAAHRHPDSTAYMDGYLRGRNAFGDAVRTYRAEHDLPPPRVLRAAATTPAEVSS